MGLAESFLAIPKYTEFSVLCFSVRPNTFHAASWVSLFYAGESADRPRGRAGIHT
jgi:hypothetical protein